MRILMLLEFRFPPHPRVEKEMRSLTAAGHEVHVLTYGGPQQSKQESIAELGTVHRWSFPWVLRPFRLLYGGRFWYTACWTKAVRRFARYVNAEAIHVHDLPLARAGIRVAREMSVPLIVDMHENWPGFMVWAGKNYNLLVRACIDHWGWRRVERQVVDEADEIVVVDPSNGNRLIALYGFDPHRIHLVSNTPNLSQLKPVLQERRFTSEESPISCLYMGRIDRGRGLHTVVDALADSRSQLPPIQFTIVGDGPYSGALKRQVEQRGVSDLVTFAGWQPYSRLNDYMATADIGIVPHVRDELTETTIPNKLFEYMAAALPVLSSDCPPIARVIKETACGRVFASEDTKDCAIAINAMCRDQDACREMGANGRAAVLDRYRWETDERRLLSLYERLTV